MKNYKTTTGDLAHHGNFGTNELQALQNRFPGANIKKLGFSDIPYYGCKNIKTGAAVDLICGIDDYFQLVDHIKNILDLE
jgi:hypothetical protein